jgi:hypothetical protein
MSRANDVKSVFCSHFFINIVVLHGNCYYLLNFPLNFCLVTLLNIFILFVTTLEMQAITINCGKMFGTTVLTTLHNAWAVVRRIDYMEFTNVFC